MDDAPRKKFKLNAPYVPPSFGNEKGEANDQNIGKNILLSIINKDVHKDSFVDPKSPKMASSNDECNQAIINKLSEIAQTLKNIETRIAAQDEKIQKQSVMIDRLCRKMFPQVSNFKIFPIDSVEDLEKIEGKINNNEYPHEDLVSLYF